MFAGLFAVIWCESVVGNSYLGVDPIVNGLILFMGLVLCRPEM